MNERIMQQFSHQKMRVLVNLKKPFYSVKYHRMNAPYKIAHITFYSAGNTGDTVLSTCIRDLFDKFWGKPSWKLISMVKPVDSLYINNINSCNMTLIGGHGAFMPDTNENEISGWEWACSIEDQNSIRNPLIVFAIGYNFFSGQDRSKCFEKNITNLVNKSIFFGLRNNGSVREIQSFLPDGLKNKVVYQPCPTMFTRLIYEDLEPKVMTNKIAFNVALDRSKNRMGTNAEIIQSQIADSMFKLSKKGYEIHFVAHCDTEIAFLRYLQKYSFKYYVHCASAWGAKQAIDFYNKMDCVIGMRGHGIWIPFGVGCHVISLGNQNKTKWFLEDIEALDWMIDINEYPEHLSVLILDKFHKIHETDGSITTQRIKDAQKKLYEITINNLATIQKQLDIFEEIK